MNATHEQLHNAFKKVANYRDWKAPISRLIKASDLEITLQAIEFYTATKGRVEYRITDENGTEVVHVTAPGYRMGPAGDH